ncbi:unnamed protein product [Camellia sinensis]
MKRLFLMALSFQKELNQVLFEENAGVRKVILNRPKKLNILNYEMVCQMLKKLEAYENDPTVKLVILKGNGKAFCAGGDVTAVITFITTGHWSFGASFYRKQLALDYLLGTYKKPLVSLINGFVFAMPETSIGLFPDVGASHFLSRLPGFFGEYLGLTGARLDGIEMLTCGLATHFVNSKQEEIFIDEIIKEEDLDSLEIALNAAGYSDTLDIMTISKIINKFVQKVHIKQDSSYRRLEIINKCFSRETVEEILSSLEKLVVNNEETWIIEAINSMKSASPTSLKIFLRSIREGRTQKLKQCLVREFNVLCHIMRRTIHDDFFEGSRAMFFDKDKRPQWKPSKLEQVSEEMVNQCSNNIDDDDWEKLQIPTRSMPTFTVQSKI